MSRFTKHARKLLSHTGVAFVLSALLMAILRWFHPAVFSTVAVSLSLFVGALLFLLPLLQRVHD